MADVVLERLSPEFDHMYASAGRALFDEVVWAAGQEGVAVGRALGVDGPLIEAAAF